MHQALKCCADGGCGRYAERQPAGHMPPGRHLPQTIRGGEASIVAPELPMPCARRSRRGGSRVAAEFTQPGNSAGVVLVRDFMAREELAARFRNIRTPILLFTGVRGSGKTTLLTGLEGLL